MVEEKRGDLTNSLNDNCILESFFGSLLFKHCYRKAEKLNMFPAARYGNPYRNTIEKIWGRHAQKFAKQGMLPNKVSLTLSTVKYTANGA